MSKTPKARAKFAVRQVVAITIFREAYYKIDKIRPYAPNKWQYHMKSHDSQTWYNEDQLRPLTAAERGPRRGGRR